jgi:hypothetical protein
MSNTKYPHFIGVGEIGLDIKALSGDPKAHSLNYRKQILSAPNRVFVGLQLWRDVEGACVRLIISFEDGGYLGVCDGELASTTQLEEIDELEMNISESDGVEERLY